MKTLPRLTRVSTIISALVLLAGFIYFRCGGDFGLHASAADPEAATSDSKLVKAGAPAAPSLVPIEGLPESKILVEEAVFYGSKAAVSIMKRSEAASPPSPAPPPPRPVPIRGLGPYQITVGDSQVLTFIFRNTLDKPLANVRLAIGVDPLGLRATHASAGYEADDGDFSWKFASLQPGEEKSLQVTVKALEAPCTRQVLARMYSETETASKMQSRVRFADSDADMLDAVTSTALFNLNTLRSQIELYKAQHGGKLPNATLSDLTSKTTYRGKSYGPYMVAIPDNPFSGSNPVKNSARATIFASDVTAKSKGGWIYSAATGDIRIDHADYWQK